MIQHKVALYFIWSLVNIIMSAAKNEQALNALREGRKREKFFFYVCSKTIINRLEFNIQPPRPTQKKNHDIAT